MPRLTTRSGMELKIGASVTTFRGEPAILRDATPPAHPGSTGRVYLELEDGTTGEYYPGVIDAEWRPDDAYFH